MGLHSKTTALKSFKNKWICWKSQSLRATWCFTYRHLQKNKMLLKILKFSSCERSADVSNDVVSEFSLGPVFILKSNTRHLTSWRPRVWLLPSAETRRSAGPKTLEGKNASVRGDSETDRRLVVRRVSLPEDTADIHQPEERKMV